ncbi:YidC/Oxa1 family membrane protein insertase [Clostridiales bacterium COT073_COT-073]|nr:YidC/Oxa1 family membrane protein insertase [Clostridiales bacterium COT073_COT-073]
MFLVSLTQSTTPIIGQLAQIFGVIIEYIYNFLKNVFGLESIGMTIILFTIFTRILLLPLAFKQQKSMREMQKLQPEMKKIQDKYKNKKDPESQQKMQMEISQLYQKNGTSPFGGCLPMLVQLPIIWALFYVLRNIPAYIGSVRQIYVGIVAKVSGVAGVGAVLTEMNEGLKALSVADFDPAVENKLIELFSKFTSEQWNSLFEKMPVLSDLLADSISHIQHIYYWLGINLADNPNLASIGVLIPVLNVVAQFFMSKLTMGNTSGNDQAAQTNKTMMYTMPFITGFFTISMPAGLGLYWLVGTLFHIGQQFVINKYLDEKSA